MSDSDKHNKEKQARQSDKEGQKGLFLSGPETLLEEVSF